MLCTIMACMSCLAVWHEIRKLHIDMSSIMEAFDATKDAVDCLMPNNSGKNFGARFLQYIEGYQLGNIKKWWSPWLQSKSHDVFTLLELCRSDNPVVRHMGINAISSQSTWHDFQYRYIAQAADTRTLVALARTKHTDSRYFLAPPSLVDSKIPVLEELSTLFLSMDSQFLPNDKSDFTCKNHHSRNCATPRAFEVIRRKSNATDDKSNFWGFHGLSVDVAHVDAPMAEDKIMLEFLGIISQYCCHSEQAMMFLQQNGLALLQRLVESQPSRDVFMSVASLLGNIALHPTLHDSIVRAGWLAVLVAWMKEKDSQLAALAARVLHNLDNVHHVLDNGIVILYPFHKSRKMAHADIVFVHGLLGGAVKTWRQADSRKLLNDNESPVSDCWPKDWLFEDCPQVRIISVHYDSSLSDWSGKSSKYHTLEQRSKELLCKLERAGVGSRPIIWIGHSMGGLLIKQILKLTDAQPCHPVRELTCGLLFYSVPHRGLSLAARSTQVHYLLYPSTEVRELCAESPHLRHLHEHFKHFVSSNGIPCLSFGEERKTKIHKSLPKILIVPPESSDPGVGEFCMLPMDHITICKPQSRDSEVYRKSLRFIHHAILFSYFTRFQHSTYGIFD